MDFTAVVIQRESVNNQNVHRQQVKTEISGTLNGEMYQNDISDAIKVQFYCIAYPIHNYFFYERHYPV